ncbi:MAG: PilN domain-containing protein [Elusimicrobia bacterium]|nr:PilN domain-containing protein [Elusimicrobiota bacterium]
MIKVNLVPADILAKARQKQQLFQISVVGAAVVVVVALVSAAHFMKARNLEAELKFKQEEYKRLEAEVALVKNLEKQAAEVRKRLEVVDSLLKGRPLYPYFMSEFVKTVPPSVWVKSLSTASTATSVKITQLSAESSSSEDIRDWIGRLEATGRFTNVEIVGSVTVSESEPKVFTFNLKADYAAAL